MIGLKTQREALKKMLTKKSAEINLIKDMISSIDKDLLRQEIKNQESFRETNDQLNDIFTDWARIFYSKN